MGAAPFLALIVGLEAGLLVLAITLAATAYLAWDGARQAEADHVRRQRLRLLALGNAVLTALAVALLAVRLWG